MRPFGNVLPGCVLRLRYNMTSGDFRQSALATQKGPATGRCGSFQLRQLFHGAMKKQTQQVTGLRSLRKVFSEQFVWLLKCWHHRRRLSQKTFASLDAGDDYFHVDKARVASLCKERSRLRGQLNRCVVAKSRCSELVVLSRL